MYFQLLDETESIFVVDPNSISAESTFLWLRDKTWYVEKFNFEVMYDKILF